MIGADTRTQPGAYLTDGTVLYEVVESENGKVVLEDCRDGDLTAVDSWRVKTVPWRLVKAAPPIPDPWEFEVAQGGD